MEKPDDKGYINVTWPSKTIPHGGIFHTRMAQPSTEQQEILRVLLEESKLSIAQRKKGAYTLRQQAEKIEPERNHVPLIRPRTSRRRSLSAIRESGALDLDYYRPTKRGEDREKLKDNLANSMAYGDKERRPQVTRHRNPQQKLPTKKEQWHELIAQIRERADWLAEMEYLGHGAPHRDLVEDQIAERLRALDALGIDSKCSSARSTGSGFSIIPSAHSESSKKDVQTDRSKQSNASNRKSKFQRQPGKRMVKEENVSAYEKLTTLQHSPRRRV